MITAQVESLTENLELIKPMFDRHWNDLALDQERVPLDPQYDTYLARDARGEVLFATLRRDGAIIGYFVGFVAPGMHYKTCLTLTMDIFYTLPENRKAAWPVKLFRCALQEAKRRGVQRIFLGSKLHKDVGRLYAVLGFKPIETYYSAMTEDLGWLR